MVHRFSTRILFFLFFVVALCFFPSQAKKEKASKKTGTTDIVKVFDSKIVKRIHRRKARRMESIGVYKRKGFIGEREDGLLAIRTTKGLSKAKKKKLEKLVAAENRDRNKLYRILARAKGRSKKEEVLLRFDMFRAHLDVDLEGTYYFEKGYWRRK